MKEQRLNGALAIVNGSDSGIGQATAMAFAREGADVMLPISMTGTARNERLEKLKAHGARQRCFILTSTIRRMCSNCSRT